VFELLGLTGIAISVAAYLPQVVHLAREHCSAGVSRRAWTMWLASSLLVGALAVHRDRFVWDGSGLTFDRHLTTCLAFQRRRARSPDQGDAAQPARGNHDGGVLAFGPTRSCTSSWGTSAAGARSRISPEVPSEPAPRERGRTTSSVVPLRTTRTSPA
jgi:PQ loop repeat